MRVFISYSHSDLPLVERIVGAVERAGLEPIWDEKFMGGPAFLDQVKLFIAHAHVFVPLLTEVSLNRGWVHQEIGYALAMGVPVLPVADGALPGEMIQGLNAIRVKPDEVEKQLTKEIFERLIGHHQDTSLAHYHCAESLEERTTLIIRYANSVLNLFSGQTGCVRQKAALSSFHLPKEVVSHDVWKKRTGQVARSMYACKLLRRERVALEKHVKGSGCKLIIDPTLNFASFGCDAKKVRLKTLLDFMYEYKGDERVQVVLDKRVDEHANITMVGDWFYCESITSSQQGYRQTIFTRHAPSMLERIEEFDHEFDELLAGRDPQSVKREVIALIEGSVREDCFSVAAGANA